MSLRQTLVVGGFLAIIITGLFFWPVPLTAVAAYIATLGMWGYAAYVLVLVIAVVLVPVTVVPIIPLVAGVFGPFITGVLTVVGWTLGSAIAFLLARTFGRPLLECLMDTKNLDAVVARFPLKLQFVSIFLLRHILPVDLMSYALGLIPGVRFGTYLAATGLGVIWFSFAFAYLGEAFLAGNRWLFIQLAVASLAIFSVAWYMLKRAAASDNSNHTTLQDSKTHSES